MAAAFALRGFGPWVAGCGGVANSLMFIFLCFLGHLAWVCIRS